MTHPSQNDDSILMIKKRKRRRSLLQNNSGVSSAFILMFLAFIVCAPLAALYSLFKLMPNLVHIDKIDVIGIENIDNDSVSLQLYPEMTSNLPEVFKQNNNTSSQFSVHIYHLDEQVSTQVSQTNDVYSVSLPSKSYKQLFNTTCGQPSIASGWQIQGEEKLFLSRFERTILLTPPVWVDPYLIYNQTTRVKMCEKTDCNIWSCMGEAHIPLTSQSNDWEHSAISDLSLSNMENAATFIIEHDRICNVNEMFTNTDGTEKCENCGSGIRIMCPKTDGTYGYLTPVYTSESQFDSWSFVCSEDVSVLSGDLTMGWNVHVNGESPFVDFGYKSYQYQTLTC